MSTETHHRVYFRKARNLAKSKMEGLGPDVKQTLFDTGLPDLRKLLGADNKSPVMVVVK